MKSTKTRTFGRFLLFYMTCHPLSIWHSICKHILFLTVEFRQFEWNSLRKPLSRIRVISEIDLPSTRAKGRQLLTGHLKTIPDTLYRKQGAKTHKKFVHMQILYTNT